MAVIDPGPDDPRHLAALAAAVARRAGGGGPRHPRAPRSQRRRPRLRRPGGRAGPRARRPGGRALARRWPRLAAAGGLGGGEGIDARLPRRTGQIGEGATSSRGPGWTLTALATPGHTGDSPELRLGRGRGAVLRRPRHGLGDDADLAARRRPRGLPGERRAAAARGTRRSSIPATARRSRDPQADHGPRPRAPGRARGRDPRARWRAGRRRAAALVAAIYADVDPALHGAAARNVLAHLIDLGERGLAAAEGPSAAGAWRLAATP